MVEVVVVEAADGVHEVADAFGGGKGVEGEDAGGWRAGDVLCGGSVGGGVHVDGEVGGGDQSVAPQAAGSGGKKSADDVDLSDGSVSYGDLHADLGGRDEAFPVIQPREGQLSLRR
ncbi:hypothetical protein OHB54_46155 [Streptomyces sp. NBC_01007]|nr:hypothetical protein OHB54_46155 [Streptomyces sp. NBC_01007]